MGKFKGSLAPYKPTNNHIHCQRNSGTMYMHRTQTLNDANERQFNDKQLFNGNNINNNNNSAAVKATVTKHNPMNDNNKKR